jgi:hypothetical protein
MKIKIKGNAHELYRASNLPLGSFSDSWYEKLKAIAGMTVVVETKHLFKDQFNTPPIEGVSKIGMRVMMQSVEEVVDDEREYMLKCTYCGQMSEVCSVTSQRCPHCNQGDYLVALSNSAKVSFDYMLRARAERAAGGKCEINESMTYIGILMSDGSEYFMQGEEADNLLEEFRAIDWLSCEIEDYFLAIAQDW